MRLSTNICYFVRIVKNKMSKRHVILLVLMVAVKAETVSNETTEVSRSTNHDNENHIEPSVVADEDKLRRLENIAMKMEEIIEQLNEDLEKIEEIKSVKKTLRRRVSDIGGKHVTNKGEIHQLLTMMDVSSTERKSMLENIKRRTNVIKNTVIWFRMFTDLADTMKLLEDGEQLPEFEKILEEIIKN